MNQLSKRLEKLESIAKSSKPTKWVRVVWNVGETREQALAKAGEVEREGIWVIRLIRPSISETQYIPARALR